MVECDSVKLPNERSVKSLQGLLWLSALRWENYSCVFLCKFIILKHLKQVGPEFGDRTIGQRRISGGNAMRPPAPHQ